MLTSVFVVAALAASAAQSAPRLDPVFAGDCSVTVILSGPRVGDVVQVLLNLGAMRAQSVTDAAQTRIEVPTGSPLQNGQSLRLLINGSEISGANATVEDSNKRPADRKPSGVCAEAAGVAPQGDSLRATAYAGWAYDQFAPSTASADTRQTPRRRATTASCSASISTIGCSERTRARRSSGWPGNDPRGPQRGRGLFCRG